MNKMTLGKLLGTALLLTSAFLINPSSGNAQACCTCDFQYCYNYCYEYECGTSQSCQDCYRMCDQAAEDCVTSCPWPIC